MGTTFKAVLTLTTVGLAAVALMALPAAAHAAGSNQRAQAPLAPGAGYASPHGSHPVRVLQRELELAGEQPGPVDGLFGPRTEAAVVRFQLRSGLSLDGIAGPLTQAALRQAARTLRPGAGYAKAHGSARVRTLQRVLRVVGVDPGPVDGRFGPRTEAAVLRFQRQHGLTMDGLAGDKTLRALGRMRTRVVARNHAPHKTAQRVSHRRPSPRVQGRKARAALHPEHSLSKTTVILTVSAVLLANIALLVGSRAVFRRRRPATARPEELAASSPRPQPEPTHPQSGEAPPPEPAPEGEPPAPEGEPAPDAPRPGDADRPGAGRPDSARARPEQRRPIHDRRGRHM